MDNPQCYGCGDRFPVLSSEIAEGATGITLFESIERGKPCRAIVICTVCLDKGDFDMWTNERGWDAQEPRVPYKALPVFDHENEQRDDATRYPSVDALMKAPSPS